MFAVGVEGIGLADLPVYVEGAINDDDPAKVLLIFGVDFGLETGEIFLLLAP